MSLSPLPSGLEMGRLLSPSRGLGVVRAWFEQGVGSWGLAPQEVRLR